MSLPKTDDNGVVQTDSGGIPVSWDAGLGYDAAGNLCITSTLSASDVFVRGRRVAADGSLVITQSTPGGQPFNYNSGWPTDKNTGAVITQSGTPAPTDPRIAGVAIGPLGGVYMSEGGALIPPSVVTTPVIAGTGEVGTQLTLTHGTYAGTAPINLSWMWITGSASVPGGMTYDVLPTDVGFPIYVSETASNAYGDVTASSNTITGIPAPGFDPLTLYVAGGGAGLGAWIDPSDLSTLFQNSDLTNPVTAAGQTVGSILDKSGSGALIFQNNATSRVVYQTDGTYHWLETDGVDDYLVATLAVPVVNEFWGFQSSDPLGVASYDIALGSPGNLTTWEIDASTTPYGGRFSIAANTVGGVQLAPNTAGQLALSITIPIVYAETGILRDGVSTGTEFRFLGGYGYGYDAAMRLYQYLNVNTISASDITALEAWIATKIPPPPPGGGFSSGFSSGFATS